MRTAPQWPVRPGQRSLTPAPSVNGLPSSIRGFDLTVGVARLRVSDAAHHRASCAGVVKKRSIAAGRAVAPSVILALSSIGAARLNEG